MAKPDPEITSAPLAWASFTVHKSALPEFQAGYTSNLYLVHLVAMLRSLVGEKGTAALLQHSQQLCPYPASSETQLNMLYHLSTDLLGEPLTQRMLQPLLGQRKVFLLV